MRDSKLDGLIAPPTARRRMKNTTPTLITLVVVVGVIGGMGYPWFITFGAGLAVEAIGIATVAIAYQVRMRRAARRVQRHPA